MTPTSTSEHYQAQQRLTVATLGATRRAWSRMTFDFDASWAKVGPQILALLTAAQLGSARQGVDYLPNVLAETDQPDRPEGRVAEGALVGIAPDGRTLDGLLYGAVTTAKTAVERSTSPAEALERAGRWLDMAVATVITDTARTAVSVGVVARPQIGGYVRMLNLPSCSRCAILAGKWFRWHEGFLRHPRCDCRHIPSSENIADDFTTDPRKAVEAGQVKGLTVAEREAIDDGSDVARVVNSRRGMTTTLGRKTTTERARGAARLRPEAIYAEANGNRAEAIRLLRRFGYLT